VRSRQVRGPYRCRPSRCNLLGLVMFPTRRFSARHQLVRPGTIFEIYSNACWPAGSTSATSLLVLGSLAASLAELAYSDPLISSRTLRS
jgi:hypothetical protein